jgi:hypothetical protein
MNCRPHRPSNLGPPDFISEPGLFCRSANNMNAHLDLVGVDLGGHFEGRGIELTFEKVEVGRRGERSGGVRR